MLNRALFNACTFAIVDQAMIDYLPEGINNEVLVPAGLEASMQLMPMLIDMRSLPPYQLDALFEVLERAEKFEEPPPVTLFVRAQLDHNKFAQYWNSMQLSGPRPDRQVWLRVHDPRVLHQLLHILPPMQREKVFGRCDAFTYWVGEEWCTVLVDAFRAPVEDGTTQRVVAPFPSAARWPWDRIELIGTINRALLNAGVTGAARLITKGALAEHLITRAIAKYGLVEKADLVEFATRGLTSGADFDDIPDIARVIRPDNLNADSTLTDRFAMLDKQIWAEHREVVET